ncbi:hypothetical protein WMF04_00870 [Sorangium sp. So ce260]|uniref:hypothetical protein n=1 Tax=Sorangium sp. So ce260 TaxID=3133291 RepID=UPI003F632BC0
MPRRRGLFLAFPLLCPALLAAGCAQSTDAPGATAYVLLDPAARARWTVASDGWQGAPILPVALDVEEPALLRGPERAELLPLRGGMLAHVRGAEGEVRWLAVGEEARDDRLTLHASEAAAAALAALVGGEISARRDGLWTLTAPDLLERGSFLEPPAGVLEALPDTPRAPGDPAAFTPSAAQDALDALAAVPAPGGGAPGAAEPGSAEAALVGLYAAGTRTLLLDASGGFTIEDGCTGEVLATGTYAAAAERVMLRAAGAAPIVLGRDQERLVHPEWAGFAPLAPEPSRRAAPESELIESAGKRAGEE